MEIIPVIDLLGGIVVHASGGLRSAYKPLKSVITQSQRIEQVISDLLIFYPFKKIYIADLDAIEGQRYSLARYQQLVKQFPQLTFYLDAGIRTVKDKQLIQDIAGIEVVIGSETLIEETMLEHCSTAILSLDFRQGLFLGEKRLYQQKERWSDKVIIMNLDVIGGDTGPDFELLDKIRKDHPVGEIILAGGVRDEADLLRLKQEGVGGVLIASALHNGTIGQAVLTRLSCVN